MRLITKQAKGRFVFVGDTHGDFDASQKVIKDYLDSRTKICFLGDYVDRGLQSKENIDFLLKTKQENPTKIYLLQGNHECYHLKRFYPCDFWENLNPQSRKNYEKIFNQLPLAFSVGKIIALHGALPNVKELKDIGNIKNKSENWHRITWGDFDGRYSMVKEGEKNQYSRPQFSQEYFEKIMKNIGKKILIRSHNPRVAERMFDNRCLKVFTSGAYNLARTIAIADFDNNKRIETIDDLVIHLI